MKCFCAGLVTLALLLAVPALGEDCQDVSYAVPTTTAVAASAGVVACDGTDDQACVTALWNVVNANRSPFLLNVYFGKADNTFYMIKNCKIPESFNQANCLQTTENYVVFIRHAADTVRTVYNLYSNGTIGTVQGPEANAYVTTGRPWYVLGNGWVPAYTFASGGSGSSYSKTFTGGVAAADRVYREPCNACLTNSLSVPTGVLVPTRTDLNTLFGVTTLAGVRAALATVWSAAQVGSPLVLSTYVGLNNDDFYQIVDCSNIETSVAPACIAATAVAARWAGQARNAVVFAAANPTGRHWFSIDAAGVVSAAETGSSGAYFCTQRPWYSIQNGWSDPYVYTTTNHTGRTFTQPIRGGVVGIDNDPNEPCTRPAPCQNLNFAATHSPSLLLAAGLVAFVALFKH